MAAAMAIIASMASPPSCRMARPASVAALWDAATAARPKVGVSLMGSNMGRKARLQAAKAVYSTARPTDGRKEPALADKKPLHMENLLTISCVAILVGTELVGVSWAAGWALGGILGLPPLISRGVEVIGALFGLVLVYYFVRAALKVEPIRG